ncbi:hypothetical protein RHGRI_006251 [Rhododendron griersonianum]|uniref:Myb/SANT-like domain-containing protein n=1 Tax=Rhododendron griersonianum TaxID=479676 RepID=A0AAV6KTF9_9ERIC|nr:hypothetical protein RHGRI_006251 [Rhododendron griersonianum]
MATKGNVIFKIEDDDDVEVGGVADSLWSKKNEAFFIDIMEEEVKTMGSRDTGTFQIKSWARMRKSLSARAKYEYSELQIKNKFNQLRTMHTKFKSLCDQSGVGWCAEKGTVTAKFAWGNLNSSMYIIFFVAKWNLAMTVTRNWSLIQTTKQ